ncbi:hypothetical protein F8568_031370 [Actinomadura sp. LD22]|uniref:Uncharacterized protein n=1 Tax=Actinomadura physcomitrii TaxID=2650748 RepID=A0A6I4MG89_9ACTN|nr:hypothetical protein [Actinomadura physcomitrii]MWA04792.1 hypothetical protein [Actinomadura physcomitrii]
MGVDPVSNPAKPGERVQVDTHITATGGDVSGVKVVGVSASPGKATVGGECTAPYTSTGCSVGDLTSGHRGTVVSTVSVPATIEDDLTVTFSIEVSATDIPAKTWTAKIKFLAPTPTPTKTPTKSPAKSPTKSPSKSPPPSKSATPSASSSGSGSGSSSGSGSGSSGGSSGTTSDTGYAPTTNSSFQAKNPQVALPPIAAPSPSVAPNSAAVTPESRLRGNKAPVAQDLTFERVASTQVAWLAALMVAIAVLLTQLRLGRRRAPAGAASAAARRARGMHRRTRRGMFSR